MSEIEFMNFLSQMIYRGENKKYYKNMCDLTLEELKEREKLIKLDILYYRGMQERLKKEKTQKHIINFFIEQEENLNEILNLQKEFMEQNKDYLKNDNH